ncbi:hypothetical protein GQ54DRAFT_323134 [Martensiomyces pterosporus]|nr:hypothetical protein GQ54DRAFT_323134 [Martensiomyces pterosporus]
MEFFAKLRNIQGKSKVREVFMRASALALQPFLPTTLSMTFLDKLPLDILLAVVKWLMLEHSYRPEFCKLLPLASVSTSLRQSLLPLLYRDLVLDFRRVRNYSPCHSPALANSAGCSEYVQRVSLLTKRNINPDDIIRVVRDGMDAENETKWPNLRSYAYIYPHNHATPESSFPCSNIIRQLDKKLPKLRQSSPATFEMPTTIAPLVYTPPSVSFLTQLTSLYLNCDYQCIDANRLPHIFAPTLVDLTLHNVKPENVWNIFYDGHENQTVVFARLKRLAIRFKDPLSWKKNSSLPPHLQGATRGMLTKRSVWAAGAAGGEPACQVPLFPVLHTLICSNMAYNFHDFISRTQCHNSLVSLYVDNYYVHFDFDAELFKSLEAVDFFTYLRGRNEEDAGSMDLYKSAFTSLLRTKTNIQRMRFGVDGGATVFQVPPDIGCTNLRSLILGVEVDFKSMLRLLSSLKHLVELEISGKKMATYKHSYGRDDTPGYIDELQPPQAEYPPVSSTLRRFKCSLYNPKRRRCYTVSYALELALHLPVLESMTLAAHISDDVVLIKALLGRFLQQMSRSPYMNNGLLNARVSPYWEGKEPYFWERRSYWG